MKPNILVSSCLCGCNCKYNGGNNLNVNVLKLEDKYNLIKVCPEVLGELLIPRDPSEIINDKVFSNKFIDVTNNFIIGAQKALEIAKLNNVKFAILKDRSPSCGVYQVYDGTFSSTRISGQGITTKLLLKNNIMVYSENDNIIE